MNNIIAELINLSNGLSLSNDKLGSDICINAIALIQELESLRKITAEESLRVWRLTRLEDVSANMASSGNESKELIKLFDRVRDAIEDKMMDEHA
jgi:hypothetical protein